MVKSIRVILRKKDLLVVDLDIDLQPSEMVTAPSEPLKCASKAKQRFHLRNHVHYGHQVNLGHQHTKSARVNKRQLLRSPFVEQPSDLLEQIVENKAKMIEMHAF